MKSTCLAARASECGCAWRARPFLAHASPLVLAMRVPLRLSSSRPLLGHCQNQTGLPVKPAKQKNETKHSNLRFLFLLICYYSFFPSFFSLFRFFHFSFFLCSIAFHSVFLYSSLLLPLLSFFSFCILSVRTSVSLSFCVLSFYLHNPFFLMLNSPLILKPVLENPKSGKTTFRIASTLPVPKSTPIRGPFNPSNHICSKRETLTAAAFFAQVARVAGCLVASWPADELTDWLGRLCPKHPLETTTKTSFDSAWLCPRQPAVARKHCWLPPACLPA